MGSTALARNLEVVTKLTGRVCYLMRASRLLISTSRRGRGRPRFGSGSVDSSVEGIVAQGGPLWPQARFPDGELEDRS